MKLTKEHQALVTDHLNIVKFIVEYEIKKSKSVIDLEYDDLYQTGCLALCKAANTYDKDKAKFSTYASKVIKNALIDYLRKVPNACVSLDAPICDDEDTCHIEKLQSDENIEEIVFENDINKALSESKKQYHGVVLKGIESLELKLKGYTGLEIAQLYGVKTNHISAWISKATRKLKENPDFMAAVFNI